MRRALVALVLLVVAACGSDGATTAVLEPAATVETTGATTVDSVAPGPSSTAAPSVQFSNLPAIHVDELPEEAVDTLTRIEAGGPFPYEQDGSVFQNREDLLPDQPRGYYREYTVPTPGDDDRGPRRIVIGDDGDRYWTVDHYDSFAEIVGES